MTTTCVLFIQGGGKGAHAEDGPLADSLKRALGPKYDVRFPQMPDESDPNVASWKEKLATESSRIPGKAILVGHSIGGSILLRYLSWDEDRWNLDDLKLPRDIAERLALVPRIFFYHCRDDDFVPFTHLALHAARIPRAVARGRQWRPPVRQRPWGRCRGYSRCRCRLAAPEEIGTARDLESLTIRALMEPSGGEE